MSDEIKFTTEEMKSLNGIQNEYGEIQFKLGQVALAKLRLGQQIDNLNRVETELVKNFETLQKNENEFTNTINKKDGDGTLDPKSGVFTKK